LSKELLSTLTQSATIEMGEGGSFGISVGIDKVVGMWLGGGQGGRSGSSRLSSYCFGGSGSALVQDLDFQLETPGFRFLH
jgi:hypothetical protein